MARVGLPELAGVPGLASQNAPRLSLSWGEIARPGPSATTLPADVETAVMLPTFGPGPPAEDPTAAGAGAGVVGGGEGA
jgi:hypothetical protein